MNDLYGLRGVNALYAMPDEDIAAQLAAPDSLPARVLDLIPAGSDNAVSMDFVAAVTGVPSRTVRRVVSKLCGGGIAIGGDSRGLFQPESEDELREVVHARGHRAATSERAYYGVKSVLENLTGDSVEDHA